MRNLDATIGEWRSRMAAGGIKSPAALDELESHLREEIERQMRSGVDEPKAFEIAVQKIGASDLLKAEFAKIRRSWEIPLGKIVGTACCVVSALYSLVLAPALVTVPELDSYQRILGLVSLSLTLLFLASLGFGYKYLPVIRSRRARIGVVGACALSGFVWLFVFSNMLPNVVVPRVMAQTITETPVGANPHAGDGFGGSLNVHNQVSSAGDSRFAQPRFVASPDPRQAIFDIGLSLFWAMTFAAALGGLAYGLEEAARRKTKMNVYV